MEDPNLKQTPSPNVPVPPASDNPIKEQNKLKTLRTFQGDVEEILKDSKGSLSSVVMAEKKRREEFEQNKKVVEHKIAPELNTPEKINPILKTLPQQAPTEAPALDFTPQNTRFAEAKNKFFLYTGILLLILGVITVASVYFIKSQDNEVQITQSKSIIPFSSTKDLNFASSTRKSAIDAVVREKKALKMPVNSVLDLQVGDIITFTTLMTPNMPSELQRSLAPQYMFGIFSYDTNEPFIILKQTDYGLSYSAMLNWEQRLVSDLGPIFDIKNMATSSVFVDKELKNKDLRILRDDERKTVMVYTFLDKNTILITANENIFSAILGKYNTSKISR